MLQPLTYNRPKPLIEVDDKTILEHQLDILKKFKIKNIIITTGPFEEQIKVFLMGKYDDINFSFVKNPQYDTTNYIYSLWLTKDLIDDDILLVHGDLIFTEKLFRKIINSDGNRVPINKKIETPKKDFKAVVKKGRVIKIGVNFFQENAFFSLPIYKFCRTDFLRWMDKIEKEIKNGNVNIYAEDAFNKISNEILLKPLYFDEEICMEIDTMDDLKDVRYKLKNRLDEKEK